MQHILKSSLIVMVFTTFLLSCGGGKEKGKLGDKKAAVEKLKAEQKKITDQINKLEGEIAVLDPTAVKAKLVSVEAIGDGNFDHFIDLQGKIDAKNTAYAAPKGQPGVVKEIYVKQGQYVHTGQLLLKLDDALARQQVAAAQQQTGSIKANLGLAQTTYQRYKNLWASNIGTEMNVINAKAQVEALTSQLRAAEANVAAAREQQNYSNITAGTSGTIDQLNVRVGETFSGMGTNGPQVSIVNTSNLKLLVNVPETYLDRVKQGTPLVITLPDANNKKINTTASVVSKLIDPATRSFYVEANVPQDASIRANQVAKVQIRDYATSNAITIPVNTLQTDDEGKYVLVAVKEANKLVARKKRVNVGELYDGRLEVKAGLAIGDQLINEGFQSLYEGQAITTQAAK